MATEDSGASGHRLLMRTVRHLTPAGVLLVVGAWLLADGIRFTLYAADPVTGRADGCYTTLEVWLGVQSPAWLRTVELIGAITLVPLGMLKLFEFFTARRAGRSSLR